ncbi:hypothetical protein B9Z55_019697 [Caenorhabditis nigoni]|uniref:Chitin-binding type-2 domain-containing protein n=2 Tax=Caenorhabditis nigoni TaxID=1611254 RepID=A0A2G5TJG3_9PELO|nr:hypothetical protein B9Z55_019697 [Caenorhabditis nigoni]
MDNHIVLFLMSSGALFVAVTGNGMEQMMTAEGPISPNFCNSSDILEEAGLIKSTLGQFLGYECSEEFYHCRWQSDGFRTYRKKCKPGLVYDVLGTQNCNYDYNVKSCGVRSGGPVQCNGTDFYCSLSEQCVPMSSRCDGHYDCSMEEDEQNCPLCTAGEFACKVSEQCISLDRRCNGLIECDDGTDERDCDVCGHGLFHCGKSNECIPMDERCDGRRQCPHGEDEMLCKKPEMEKKFTCQSRDYEIPTNQVCDGMPQCPDGSDEAYCEYPGSPKSQSAISFSSNLTPVSESRPAPLPPAPQQPEPEETEEDYDYEQIKDENAPAAFPMISLVPLPPTTITTTTYVPPTTRVITRVPAPATRVAKPAFSRPRPKLPSTDDVIQTSRTSLRTTSQTLPPTRQTTDFEKKMPQAIVQPPRSPALPQPKEEKVFIMQVTASPSVRPPLQELPRASSGSRSVSKALPVKVPGADNDNILAQITSQLNGGMSPELLAKIETIIKSEMQGGEPRHRRFQPRL